MLKKRTNGKTIDFSDIIMYNEINNFPKGANYEYC